MNTHHLRGARARTGVSRCLFPGLRPGQRGETFVEAIVSMSLLALIMSVTAPAFIATQKLNHRNQSAATTLSYAEKYIDEFRATLTGKSKDGNLPLCSDVVSSFDVIQRNGEDNGWWGIPTDSAAGKIKVFRQVVNHDHSPDTGTQLPNRFQVRFDQQTSAFDEPAARPTTTGGAPVQSLEELNQIACTPDEPSKKTGLLEFTVDVTSNVNAEDGGYIARSELTTWGAVRYQ
ncbi:pilus assembly FimT family protein [Pseudoclavibacter sp. 13-3]|uniref:pilus assembly FimT family protein n=1 Tax=Pseudoclavibacter sp. 13-3 TaxID=2901228 RepID=UPI001E341969|nr:hypothetical protein [Pseudoclavibacter sp. 13-3]MCD7101134.1 hypothetical protein [Pseudoclavibacter sp. 13-3]